jgi:hypothetical protein
MSDVKKEWKLLYKALPTSEDKAIFKIIFEWFDTNDFWKAPASTRFHSAFEGGLAYHSLKVAQNLVEFTKVHGLVWQREISPLLIGLLHDICKVGIYKQEWKNQKKKEPDGSFSKGPYGNAVWEEVVSYVRDDTACPLGHGSKSVILANRLIDLTEQEEMCILWHMGNFESNVSFDYSNACRKDVNVMWTHVADHLAAIQEEKEILEC